MVDSSVEAELCALAQSSETSLVNTWEPNQSAPPAHSTPTLTLTALPQLQVFWSVWLYIYRYEMTLQHVWSYKCVAVCLHCGCCGDTDRKKELSVFVDDERPSAGSVSEFVVGSFIDWTYLVWSAAHAHICTNTQDQPTCFSHAGFNALVFFLHVESCALSNLPLIDGAQLQSLFILLVDVEAAEFSSQNKQTGWPHKYKSILIVNS